MSAYALAHRENHSITSNQSYPSSFPKSKLGKEEIAMPRNSFVQMSKLHNVRGRIYYISSDKKQENLYAVYETTDRKFWRELAKCNQTEFKKSGTDGKCIEAREFIIALPESFVDYPPDGLLKYMTDKFKSRYGVDCIAALHHNKRKTNYHIHLIFAERNYLDDPIEKIATRNMFYDEKGNHVRTKREILDENGTIRKRCKVIKKGEVYERQIFTIKDARFKKEHFLDEVKVFYTDVINGLVKDEKKSCLYLSVGMSILPPRKSVRTIQRQIRLLSITKSYRTGIVLWITLLYRGWSERKS
jgi:MobA/MobL family.